MIFTNPSEYAIRALSELVLIVANPAPEKRRKPGFVMLDRLVEHSELPREFLAKIFRSLVEGGVLRSAKGPGGGFALARAPEEITLMQVVEAIDGTCRTDSCVVGLGHCNENMPCPQHDLFRPIRQRLKDYLVNTSLADTASSLQAKRAKIAAAAAAPATATAPHAAAQPTVSATR